MSSRTGRRAFVAISLLFAAIAAGCGVDESLVGARCASGYVQCGLRCVDVTSDRLNCGGCGVECASGAACVAGQCGAEASDAAGVIADARDSSTDATSSEPAPDSNPADSTVGDADTTETQAGEGDAAGDSEADGVVASSTEGGETDANADGGGVAEASLGDGGLPEVGADAFDSIDFDASEAGDAGAASEASGASDAIASADAVGSDAADTGPSLTCISPLVDCGGQCTELLGDPLNCGSCGTVCVSQLCQNAHCIGAASGGIVLIGHDYQSTAVATSQARVLSNAVFFSQSNPVHVMSYRRYADATAVNRVAAILANVAAQLGRTMIVTNTSQDDDIPNLLNAQTYDVLLVHDQLNAPAGSLALLGAQWATTVLPFASLGGVVVVLDGGTGVGEMPGFVTGTGLLTVTAHAPIVTGTQLFVTTPADVVGVGVVNPYAAGRHSVSLTTEPGTGNTVYVVDLPSDAGSAAPVVVHKAI